MQKYINFSAWSVIQLRELLEALGRWDEKMITKDQMVETLEKTRSEYQARHLAQRRLAAQIAATHNAGSDVQILPLAPELRNKIYVLTLPQSQQWRNLPSGMSNSFESRHIEPGILQTCRLIRYEAAPMYYGQQAFTFQREHWLSEADDLPEWLNRYSSPTVPLLQHVRELTISISHECPSLLAKSQADQLGPLTRAKKIRLAKSQRPDPVEIQGVYNLRLAGKRTYYLRVLLQQKCPGRCGKAGVSGDVEKTYQPLVDAVKAAMVGRDLVESSSSPAIELYEGRGH